MDANLRQTEEAIDNAREKGVDLVVFPELSLTGYSLGRIDDVSTGVLDERITSLADRAGEMSILLGFHEDSGSFRTYNSAAYFEDGSLLHPHRRLQYRRRLSQGLEDHLG